MVLTVHGFMRWRLLKTKLQRKMNRNIINKTTNEGLSEPSHRSYFHEISQDEVDKMIADKKSIGYVMENYKQPDWCNYPEALSMTIGCWALCDLTKDGLRTKISKEFCKECDSFGNCG